MDLWLTWKMKEIYFHIQTFTIVKANKQFLLFTSWAPKNKEASGLPGAATAHSTKFSYILANFELEQIL